MPGRQACTPSPTESKWTADHPDCRLKGGQTVGGQPPNPDAPHNGEKSPPPEQHPAMPAARSVQHQAGHVSQPASASSPSLHTRTHSVLAADPDCLPRGRAAGGGEAPNPRRPSRRHNCGSRGRRRRSCYRTLGSPHYGTCPRALRPTPPRPPKGPSCHSNTGSLGWTEPKRAFGSAIPHGTGAGDREAPQG